MAATTDRIAELLKRIEDLPPMTPEEREEQRRSFAYGNVAIDNPTITRANIDTAAERLEALRL